MRLSFYIYCALCAVGAYVSNLLLDIHVLAKTGGSDTGICAQGAGFSCTEAASSQFGEIAGMPVAALGLAFYVTAFILVLCARFLKSQDRFGFEDVFLAGGLISSLYSVILAGASVVVVGKWCPLCMTLYGVNIGLLVNAIFAHPEGRSAMIACIGRLPRRGGFWFALVLLLSMLPMTNFMYARKSTAAQPIPSSVESKARKPVQIAAGTSPSQGLETAPVLVVEFSDFECPYCQRLALAFKAAQKMRPDLFRYVFKHYPMDASCNRDIETAMHQNACAAALAMTCADEVGKAWALHDVMFANQSALESNELITYAAHVGIDPERFAACMRSPRTLKRVKEDINEAIRLGVEGTPTWYMNGIKQVGVRSPDDLIALFEQLNRDDSGAKPNAE